MRHSETGWATENVIIEFTEWLHHDITESSPCALVLDVYPSHRTECVIATAEANAVEHLFVPGGGTGRFHPMDRQIFGDLKTWAQADFGRRLQFERSETIDYAISVQILQKCWTSIPSANVRKAWNVV
jgi:hypothetical protein